MKVIDAIVELVKLCEEYGVNLELVTSKGEVKFKVVQFSEQEKKEDGVKDCVAICDDSGKTV